ncbi:MAG TPA: hypothetical protein VGH22_05515 [Candidatus Binatia bacterium]
MMIAVDLRKRGRRRNMTEMERSRLDQLEKDLQALKSASATRSTPVFGVAGVLALLAFIGLLASLPLPGNPQDETRFKIGLAAGFAGLIVTGLAAGFAKFALRALVEIAVVAVCFSNAVAAVAAWMWSAYLSELVSTWKIASAENALLTALALAACVIFVIDVALMLVLCPLAKVAGSNVLE